MIFPGKTSNSHAIGTVLHAEANNNQQPEPAKKMFHPRAAANVAIL